MERCVFDQHKSVRVLVELLNVIVSFFRGTKEVVKQVNDSCTCACVCVKTVDEINQHALFIENHVEQKKQVTTKNNLLRDQMRKWIKFFRRLRVDSVLAVLRKVRK